MRLLKLEEVVLLTVMKRNAVYLCVSQDFFVLISDVLTIFNSLLP